LQFDPALGEVVAETGAAVVLMHNRGRSREMYSQAVYADVMGEIASELQAAIDRAIARGISRDRILVDPGIGFSKRAEHSFEALARMGELAALGRPILSGPSRKSYLKHAVGDGPPSDREWATAAAVAASVLAGAHIVRVHGVREMVDVARVADRIRASARVD
jgi:dihydropteroate synthase